MQMWEPIEVNNRAEQITNPVYNGKGRMFKQMPMNKGKTNIIIIAKAHWLMRKEWNAWPEEYGEHFSIKDKRTLINYN